MKTNSFLMGKDPTQRRRDVEGSRHSPFAIWCKQSLPLLFAILFVLSACDTPTAIVSLSPTPKSPVISPASLTMTPTATLTLTTMPTDVYLSTPNPADSTGKIIFSAVKCAGSCEPAEGDLADIYIVNDDGNELRKIVSDLDKTRAAIAISPDAQYLAFVDARQEVEVSHYLPSQIYLFDFTSQQVTPIMANQPTQSSIGEPQWFSRNTQLAYIGGTCDDYGNISQADIYVVNIDGTGRSKVTERPLRSSIASFALSSDGSQIAFIGWMFDADPNEATLTCMQSTGNDQLHQRISLAPSKSADIQWAPNGSQFLMVLPPETREGFSHLFLSACQDIAATELVQIPGYVKDIHWSPDGESADVLAYSLDGLLTGYKVEINKKEATELFVTNTGQGWDKCRWLPQGDSIACSKYFPTEGNIEQRGIYIFNILNKTWQQIVSGYNVWDITWLHGASQTEESEMIEAPQ